jgi:hypothetical protein
MVFGRSGIGGPQLVEMSRMLKEEGERIAADAAWLKERNARLASAEASLEDAFAILAGR